MMMMNISKTKYLWILTLALGITLVSCEDDDTDETPPTQNDPELITDLILNFTDPDTGDSFEYRFSDSDGPGGDPPSIDDIILSQPVGYQVSITVQDASDPDDIEDITEEIEEEANEHQFFLLVENGAGDVLDIDYDPTDVDLNGDPVGLHSFWVTSGETTGNESVRIVLRHEPDKTVPGAAQGELSEEVGGETDIEVEFNLTIE